MIVQCVWMWNGKRIVMVGTWSGSGTAGNRRQW